MNANDCKCLDLENGCQNKDCRHHVLWRDLDLPKGKETPVSLSFSNCMCLINRTFTLEEIGELWGLTRERIRQIEERAQIKIGLMAKRQRLADLYPDGLGFFDQRYADYQYKKGNK